MIETNFMPICGCCGNSCETVNCSSSDDKTHYFRCSCKSCPKCHNPPLEDYSYKLVGKDTYCSCCYSPYMFVKMRDSICSNFKCSLYTISPLEVKCNFTISNSYPKKYRLFFNDIFCCDFLINGTHLSISKYKYNSLSLVQTHFYNVINYLVKLIS